jgi:hypothetical protein
MRDVDLERMFHACKMLTIWSKRKNDHNKLPDNRRKNQQEAIDRFDPVLREIGFAATAASFNKLAQSVAKQTNTFHDFSKIAEEGLGRLQDEAKQREFFALTLRESDHYSRPRKGWESAILRFPHIVDDVEEANKCFALSRYPAAVFHSVQIVEFGLIELGKFLEVNDPHSGWSAVSSALEKVILKKHQDRTPFEKKNFQFLEQVQGTVAGLKNAWRNKISHAHGKLVLMSREFNSEVAEEILLASRAFARRLADGLPKAKVRTTTKGTRRLSQP